MLKVKKLELYNLSNLVNEKTCYKSLQNPTCIDPFLTNCNKSFQLTKTISTGISDFHKMILSVLNTTFKKSKPREIIYRSYKHFYERKFKNDLVKKLYPHVLIAKITMHLRLYFWKSLMYMHR